MFTGIIAAQAKIISARAGSVRRVRIATPRGWKLALGQSIAIDGVCSTVMHKVPGAFEVEYMPATLAKTAAGRLEKGDTVNLERSLKLGDYVDGHFVQGHVDVCGRVVGITELGASREITIALSKEWMRFVALHGSIAINGVALTVARRGLASCTVALVPHTLSATNLRELSVGDVVNIETDMLARSAVAAFGQSGTVRRHAAKRSRTKRRAA